MYVMQENNEEPADLQVGTDALFGGFDVRPCSIGCSCVS